MYNPIHFVWHTLTMWNIATTLTIIYFHMHPQCKHTITSPCIPSVNYYRKNRKLCVDFIRAIHAGSGLPHNKKLAHLHFLYTKIHINRKNAQKRST